MSATAAPDGAEPSASSSTRSSGAPSSEPASDPIFTVGHGDRSFADMERRLALHHVQTLVDVRTTPYSRHSPEFTKDELEAIAAEAGLGYRWLGDRLGGRPSDAHLLDDTGTPDPAAIVADPRFQSGVAELLALARSSRVALLCAEVDHRHCHRTAWLAPVLEAAGRRVLHIDATGDAHAHQPQLDL